MSLQSRRWGFIDAADAGFLRIIQHLQIGTEELHITGNASA
jgi:hypothetical protein